MKDLNFSFSDTISGYVSDFDWGKQSFTLKTTDGREFAVDITETTNAEIERNLGEGYIDATAQMRDIISGYVHAYGIFYPHKGSPRFEAKHLLFPGRTDDEYVFESPDWWGGQIRQLADFFIRAQFGEGPIDYREYRTKINLVGEKTKDARQETDTISRLVYGFASAYLMTGEDRYLEAAEKGTQYLRDHMRFLDRTEGIAYWYHAIDIQGDTEEKIFASEFGDDYQALPCYEQIYALAGPTQLYRITGDPEILSDIEMTVGLFDKYYLDPDQGGYWSHVDPVTLSGTAESLGHNRSRKNWNSIGDHAPAYLINAYLATGSKRFADMLTSCADLICEHMPDYDNSPFVQEKFHGDWEKDQTWGWQQNRAVIGHNLKIAWNLTRIHSLEPKPAYKELAEKIAGLMPDAGMDRQRGGWYDVLEREVQKGDEAHRFVWHDRKAWWQQEQGILAYLILQGVFGDPRHLELARESSSFYNGFFLDHDDGGVYFNVFANGLPYLMGTERMKGSHSMSGYHAFELAYLAQVYTNLLITKEPMDFHFRPKAGAFPDGVLRVAPDLLPPGSIKIGEVTVDGEPYADFDGLGLTVKIPTGATEPRIRVRIMAGHDPFDVNTVVNEEGAWIVLGGKMSARDIVAFDRELQEAIAANPKKLTFDVRNLTEIAPAGLRSIAFAMPRLETGVAVRVEGASPEMAQRFRDADITEDIEITEA